MARKRPTVAEPQAMPPRRHALPMGDAILPCPSCRHTFKTPKALGLHHRQRHKQDLDFVQNAADEEIDDGNAAMVRNSEVSNSSPGPPTATPTAQAASDDHQQIARAGASPQQQ